MSLKILPLYSCTGSLLTGTSNINIEIPEYTGSQIYCPLTENNTSNQTLNLEDNFPLSLLQHHSVREIQQVNLIFDYRREIQLINITGVTSGEFVLVLQGIEITNSLPLTASSSTISNALYLAALNIESSKRECLYFNIRTRKLSKSLEITVEFLVDNSAPLSLLEGYSVSLTGNIFIS